VKPTAWDGRKYGPLRPKVKNVKKRWTGSSSSQATTPAKEEDWSQYVIATAISKYVFKLGRFTVHPAIVIEANGLLPPHPAGEAGWRSGETGTGTPASEEDLGEVDQTAEWDWKRVELERRKGLKYAEHFAALDGTNSLFDGGEDGAIGRFPWG
jgi:hypothetical protein